MPRPERRTRWHPSVAISCPRSGCGARPSEHCRSIQTGFPKRWPHAERKREFRELVTGYVHDSSNEVQL